MLQGTFETLSLPEVLGLLASARKSGALRLEAGPVSGVVHLEDGHCRAVETAEQRSPVAGGSALLVRLVDVCFAITRQEGGAFRFAADEAPPWLCDEPVELSDALVEVDRLLKQWREILRVIPSLDCRPRLLDALEAEEIVVDREHWALLVAIDGRRSVRELVQHAARPVIDVCHALLELVEAGAIGVVDPTAPVLDAAPVVPVPPVVQVLTVVPAPDVVRPAAEAPVVEAPVAVAAPHPGEAIGDPSGDDSSDEAGDTPDKGAFLRLFSGLRDS